jgi:predicted ATPase
VATVARICRRLDGLPLAIELAAALVRTLTPEAIAARLDDRFRLLVGGSGTGPPRQRTLQAAIDWSYDALDDVERRLFERLSVFAGSFSLEAVEATCAAEGEEIEPSSVLHLLTRLVDRSLVLADLSSGPEARYRLLETLRAYGRERLDARGEQDLIRRRHADWLVGMAERADTAFHGPDEGRWLRWAEAEHDNVRAVLSWAIEHGDAGTALRLGAALAWSWGVYGRRTESRLWLQRALAANGSGDATPARARSMAHLGLVLAFQGDYAEARTWLDAAVALGRAIEDDPAVLSARSTTALVLQITGETDAAAGIIDEVLARARRVGSHWHEGRLLAMKAQLALRRGDQDAALLLLEQDAELARAAGDAWSLAMALAEIGDLFRLRGEHARAGALYRESLSLRRGLGIPGSTPSLRHNLGYVALAAGDVAGAAEQFTDALDEFRQLGERRGVAECLIGLAGVAATDGRAGDAARLFGAGEAAMEAVGGSLWPSNRADYERLLALARAGLDAAAFETARAEGRRLPLEQAITLARSRDRPGGHQGAPPRERLT